MNRSLEIRTANVFGYAVYFWVLFTAIAVVFWMSPLFIEQENPLLRTMVLGAVSFLIGLCFRFSYLGVEIDADKEKVRKFTSILGFKIGDWENLPALQKLVLTSAVSNAWNTPNGISPTFRSTSTLYVITLVADSAIDNITIKLQNKTQAQASAKALAELLHLETQDNLGE